MRSKFYRAWSVAILAVSVLIFCVTIFLVLGQAARPQVAIEFKPEMSQVKRGEAFSVGVYFSGKDASRVSSIYLNLAYDTKKLKLEETLPGPYFVQPAVLSTQGYSGVQVALAQAPGVAGPFNPELSVVRLRFLPLEAGEVEVSISPESRVFVLGTQRDFTSSQVSYTIVLDY